jgi:ABC-2 type transport system permease protein
MMTGLVRFELEKIRTIGLPWALLAVSTAITLLLVLLKASSGGSSLATGSGLTQVIAAPDWPLILAIVFGVTVATGEFRHSTATSTYLAVPARGKVLIAKIIASASGGILFGLAASIVTTTVGLSFVAAKSYDVALSTGTIARYAGGAVLGCALLAAVGTAVGTLIRSQLGAIVAVFAWAIAVEGLLDELFNSAAPYLPFGAARSLAGAAIPGGGGHLPFAAAAGLLAGVVVLVALVASRVTLQRDIF